MMTEILSQMGFKKGWIYEVLVESSDLSKNANISPMGIKSHDLKSIALSIYLGSKTLENIRDTRKYAVYFPKDTPIFYEALFEKKTLGQSNLSDLARFEVRVQKIVQKGDAFEITGTPSNIRNLNEGFLINRAEHLLFEMIIFQTKLQSKDPQSSLKKLNEYSRTISKVAPKSIFEKRAKAILEKTSKAAI